MANARVSRGRKTQRIVAEYLTEHGFPYALSVGAAESGSDVTGCVGLDIECKATAGVPLTAALIQQAKRKATGAVGIVVWRPNGYGPERLGEWVMAMRFDEGVDLLRAAGFGEPIERTP